MKCLSLTSLKIFTFTPVISRLLHRFIVFYRSFHVFYGLLPGSPRLNTITSLRRRSR